MQVVQDPWWKIRDKIKILHGVPLVMNLNSFSDLRQLLCSLTCHWHGSNAITEPDSQLWIWTPVPFWDIIVSNCVSHHLKRFKLHFNYLPILDTTVTELPTILHLNCRSFTSEQALSKGWLMLRKPDMADRDPPPPYHLQSQSLTTQYPPQLHLQTHFL